VERRTEYLGLQERNYPVSGQFAGHDGGIVPLEDVNAKTKELIGIGVQGRSLPGGDWGVPKCSHSPNVLGFCIKSKEVKRDNNLSSFFSSSFMRKKLVKKSTFGAKALLFAAWAKRSHGMYFFYCWHS